MQLIAHPRAKGRRLTRGLAFDREPAYIRRSFMTIDDARLRRLKFRAWHRGFREADLILGPFADKHASSLSLEQIEEFERLMQAPDHDLYNWIVERDPTPPEMDGEIMRMLKAFRDEAHSARGPDRGG
ncbi:succinate dehydrogenase assembly factor 2 [Phenylobacterium sp.]|uniref:succinate dehydrogenase assembly factor 2 n=1 Tax=Phenylobacterium sp. TaxID=1871053 RepID=UPI0035B0FDBD